MAAKLGISAADRRRALELAATLAGCDERDALSGVFRELPRFVGSESVTFGEVEVPSRPDGPLVMRAECSDRSIYDAQMMEAMSRLWRQQPVIAHQLRHPTSRPVKISDLIGAAEWRRTELQNDGYRRVGLVHEMAVHFSWEAGGWSCAALHRSGSDFSERERALLALVAPHLEAARDRIAMHERLLARIDELEALPNRGEASADDVRDALRDFHRPGPLAHSPLARGSDQRERAESVRRLLASAVAHAFGTAPDEMVLRTVIERGYLEPGTSHEQVAREMYLSRTSYFRRLRRASARLASWILGPDTP
jgi:hypothetical protein